MAVVRVNATKIEPADSAQSSISSNGLIVSAGNLIVVVIRCGANGLVSSVTDTAGNTYVEAISDTTQDPKLFIYYAKNVIGHAANVVTINFSPSAEFSWAGIIQYSGLDTVSPVDAVDVKTGTGVTDLISDPFSTTGAGVVVLGASQAAFTTYSAGADFTLLDGTIGNSAGEDFGGIEERITNGALSSYTAHITSGVTTGYTLGLVAFKATPEVTGPSLFRGRHFSFFDDEEVNRFEFWPATVTVTAHERAAALTATAGIASTGESFSVFERSASISATASIVSDGHGVVERSATLSAIAAATVTGTRIVERSVTVSTTASVASSGAAFTVFERAVSTGAIGSVESSGTAFSVVEAATTFSGTAVITVAGMREALRSASCAATATIESSAQFFSVFERAATLGATGSIETAATFFSTLERQSTINAAADIDVGGQSEQLRQAAVSAAATITVSGVAVPPGVVEHERSAAVGATGAIESAAEFFSTLTAAVQLAATATIDIDGLSIRGRLVMIEATGAVTVSHQRTLQRLAGLAAAGVIEVAWTATGAIVERAAEFNATAIIATNSRHQRPTPPRRTFVVQSEQRTLTVDADRIFAVAVEEQTV